METSIRGTSLKQQIASSLGLSLTEIFTPNKTNDSAVQETSIVEPITPCKTQVKSTKFANKTLKTDSITIEDQILHDDQEPQSEDNNEKTHGSVHKTPKRKKFKPKVIQDRGMKFNKTPNSKPGISNPSFSPQTPNSPSFKAPITPEPKPNNLKISINSDLKPINPKDPITPNPKLVDSNESIIMDPVTPLKPDIVYGRRKKKAFIVMNEQKDIVHVRRKKRCVNINNDEKDMGIHDRKINVDENRAGTGLNCDDVIELVRKPVQRRLDFVEEGLIVNKSLIDTTSSCEDLMREVSVGTELVPKCLIGTSSICEDLMEECNVGTELAPKSLNGTDLDCEDAIKETNVGTNSSIEELDPNSSIGNGLDCEDVIKETNVGTEIYPNLSKSSIGTDQNCEESKSLELVSKDLDRVTLKENISLLAIKKFPGIKWKNRQKVTKNKKLNKKFEKLMNKLIFGMKNLNLNSEMYAIVPYKEKKHRGKVILDEKTIKEWNIIMRKENSASSEPGADLENEIFWRSEREIFSNLAESFIAQMKLIQGDRRFSEWKGSVVDSVVGAYLTQNVSDHMSSSAFISLASRFPQKTSEETKNTPKINNDSKAEKKGYKSGKENIDWDALRRYATQNRYEKERETVKRDDSVNWDAVRKADVNEVAKAIHGRGMDNVLAERIQDFLNRVAEDHEKVDLEWLREVDGDQAKEYLLSIFGLGLKSVECIRLLTLHQAAFPVDTNVGRICVRLGWVPLQPLPESLQIHLLELYPVMDSIQKYLWPRLCKLDQKALYELHYQMITFGKVFCTKNKPNCNACPLRSECKHFASAFASARLMLPGPNNEELNSIIPIQKTENPIPIFNILHESNNDITKPIIEEPSSPIEENQETLICSDIEDVFADDDPDEIPTIKLDMESFVKRLEQVVRERNREREIDIEDISKTLMVLPPVHTSIPLPKLKNPAKLRTVHDVYEIPDSHSILKRLDLEERDIDDPSHYLFVLWTPEKENSSEPKKPCRCRTCKNCEIFVPLSEDEKNKYVEGSILIPCRTAMRGSFPLNGTYFQVNEVFADHGTSRNPIRVSRDEIWRLRRLPCYCGTSVTSVLKGLPTDEIQFCFWRGFICVREFDREKRSPKALSSWLHNRPSIKTNK